MARAFASAQISFGLVSIPVRLFTATEASEKISFNMLHKECGSRIQQQLYCPKDERTIERTDTVKGYEFSRGQYVTFTEEELKALEEKSTQTIDIAPDKGGARAYALLSKALEQTGRWALAKYAARGKQYLVILRPLGKGLVMQQLFYPNEIRAMDDLDLGDAVIKDNELKMAVQLAEMGASDEFHPENYRDDVADRIKAQIQNKIDGGEEITAEAEQPRAQVIDLMEALKASLASPKPRAAKSSARIPVKAEKDRKPAKAAPRNVTSIRSRSR